MCNKITYETKKEALNDACFIFKSNRTKKEKKCKRNKDNKLRAYICPACGKYHLTSIKKLKYKKYS